MKHIFFASAIIIAASLGVQASEPKAATVLSPNIPSSVSFAGSEISLDEPSMYERYDRELTSMVFTHGSTLLTLKRANKIFPIVAPILKKNGIPADLIYLACIESSLDPTAISPAKAAGLWQFMPTTGREYGLEVNDNVDERFNIEKATEAACKFLKRAYAKYGNWESVAASYNAGQGRISTELEAQQVESAYRLFLNNETSRYIFRLLAMKAIMENPKEYGFTVEANQLYQPVDYRAVPVDTAVASWPKWAKEQGIDYLTLRLHNPWIRSRSLPAPKDGKTYNVLIPTEASMRRSTGRHEVFNNSWIEE